MAAQYEWWAHIDRGRIGYLRERAFGGPTRMNFEELMDEKWMEKRFASAGPSAMKAMFPECWADQASDGVALSAVVMRERVPAA